MSTTHHRLRRRSRGGFTLVEVLIATALLGFSLLVMFGFHSQAVRSNMHARKMTDCTYLAQLQMERLMSLRWTESSRPSDLSDLGSDLTVAGTNADEWPWLEHPNGGAQPTAINAGYSSSDTTLGQPVYYLTWDIEDTTHSHLAVGVPGTVDGLLDVLEKYGTMNRDQVMRPAITLAKTGFVIDHDLARDLEAQLPRMAKYPASLAVFSNQGKPWKRGDVLRQQDLARSLDRIRRYGRDGFYRGRTAELLIAEMQRGGGLITQQDLDDYQSVWRTPVRGTYRGHEVISMPPPSSGGVLLVQILNMLEPYDLRGMGFGSADAVHHMVEAERRAYADRAEHLGDPDFFPVPVDRLVAKSYALGRFADFDPRRASRSSDIRAGSWPKESVDTTHASFVDKAGNAVAYTTTLNLSYGSKIVAAGTGMLLNNEMDDFSAKPDTPNAYGLLGREANAIQPRKRMLSSMTPTIVAKDGKVLLVTGSPGGSTIITTTLQVIVNVIDHGMDLSAAVASPRVHHQWQPDAILYEKDGLSPDTVKLLVDRGHQGLTAWGWERGIGDANSVMVVPGGFAGMADPRNPGAAVQP